MSLCDVRFQGRAQDSLQRAFRRRRVPHAYIFQGPDGVGKESLARGFAQLLLCKGAVDRVLEADAARHVGVASLCTGCGTCDGCRLILANTHPDVHVIYRQLARQHPDPEARRRTGREIGIDVVRHFLVEKTHLTPVCGRAKVLMVKEAERITEQAQNALLKTLEEPAPATYLILLTTSADRMLPTILSRCQIVEFGSLPTPFVRERLGVLHPQLPGHQLDWYAQTAEGSLGRAVEAAGLELWTLARRVTESIAELDDASAARTTSNWLALGDDIGQRVTKDDPDVTETEARRIGLKTIFQIAADVYAGALRTRTGYDAHRPGQHRHAVWEPGIQPLEPDQLIERINRLARAQRQLDRNVHVHLCLETLLADVAAGVAV